MCKHRVSPCFRVPTGTRVFKPLYLPSQFDVLSRVPTGTRVFKLKDVLKVGEETELGYPRVPVCLNNYLGVWFGAVVSRVPTGTRVFKLAHNG